jgi:transposase InsO family protein
MTSVWVAEHGWCYLNAAIDCCARENMGWALDVRCRAQEAIGVIDDAITHRRGGYCGPESQAFIESWFSKLKQRCVWREEFETSPRPATARPRTLALEPLTCLKSRTPRPAAPAITLSHDAQRVRSSR